MIPREVSLISTYSAEFPPSLIHLGLSPTDTAAQHESVMETEEQPGGTHTRHFPHLKQSSTTSTPALKSENIYGDRATGKIQQKQNKPRLFHNKKASSVLTTVMPVVPVHQNVYFRNEAL